MLAVQWSQELPNIIADLKKLNSQELISRLKDLKVSLTEKQAITKAFSSSEMNSTEGTNGTWY